MIYCEYQSGGGPAWKQLAVYKVKTVTYRGIVMFTANREREPMQILMLGRLFVNAA
jgi:hypothetical protein